MAALALSLLPVIFYRNAFPYYYVVMLAPVCVLAATASDSIYAFVERRVDAVTAGRIRLLICVAAAVQSGVNLSGLRRDDIAQQRAVVAAVHQIFPHPVPYIDHSGMIASFPKANFFMSSWGIQDYRASGVGFMRDAIKRRRPPLLLSDREVLKPGTYQFKYWLLPEDRALIEKFYLPYWGPIRIAGSALTLTSGTATAELPFAGRYRIESAHAILIAGKTLRNGDSVEVFGQAPRILIGVPPGTPLPLHVQLVSAEAGPRPHRPPPAVNLYAGL